MRNTRQSSLGAAPILRLHLERIICGHKVLAMLRNIPSFLLTSLCGIDYYSSDDDWSNNG